jgi:predicted porin
MRIRSKAKPMLAALAAMATALAGVGFAGTAVADDKATNDQVKILMQRVDELTKEVQTLKKAPAQGPLTTAAPAAAKPVVVSAESKLDSFIKGFYGTLDVSFDDTTKGMDGMVAYHLLPDGSGVDLSNPKGGGAGPVGRVGWMPALSTNKSQIGYRGDHKIGDSGVKLIYQVETALAITAAPGLRTSQYQQSNVVNGAVGLGDTFIGFQGKDWGRVKFGTFYSPYKKSTDRLNPFSGMLGDYSVIMGNSGGDNRVEFGTRLEHSFAYESPKWNGFSFNVLYSPGQNRTYDNVVQSSGSPDCSGGNMPGSGNLLLNCDDGGFDNAFSTDIQFEYEGFYATAAYEIHKNVNRNSDGIGSNSPQYGNLLGAAGVTGAVGDTTCNDPSGLLDCATFQTLVSEYPYWSAVGGGTPPYLNDIADEAAFKVGAQYKFAFGLTVSGAWEHLTRNLPAALDFQNERQRNGSWFALSQDLTPKDNLSAGWAHAGKTPGDPGGQHNYNPNPAASDNSADMYTLAWKHKFDKQVYWYLDWALTVNHGNAHYDIGAGGRGLTTDCHDATNATFIDYGSYGNTTWGGCRPMGFSTGVNYKF